jgi:hypothetical protein
VKRLLGRLRGEGEITARVGRVRSLDFLSSLLKAEARRSGPLFKPDEVVVD